MPKVMVDLTTNLREDQVFQQHALDLHTPAGSCVFDDFADAHGNFFAALDYVLQETSTNDVAEGGLRAFDERLADVGDGEGGAMGLVDVVVND